MRYLRQANEYIVKLSIDDELQSSLVELGQAELIDAAHFWGIGAAKDIVVGSYDLKERAYRKVELEGVWEIASLTGSLAQTDEGPILHVHGVFSDEGCQTRGGHVFRLVCAATVELFLVPLAPGLCRKYDDQTGLKLLDL
jgi:predicted DNA-binding protein with PD1-like motif